MNTRTSNASNARDLLTTPASDRERGPTLLTERSDLGGLLKPKTTQLELFG